MPRKRPEPQGLDLATPKGRFKWALERWARTRKVGGDEGHLAKLFSEEFGKSDRSIYRYLASSKTTEATKLALSDALDVPLVWLFYGKGVPPEELSPVANYLRGPGKALPDDVKQTLREMPIGVFETATPKDEEVKPIADFVAFRSFLKRSRNDGHKNE